MNWDQVEGKWEQVSGKVKSKWGKLTDDDIKVAAGKRDVLVGKLRSHYGMAKDNAEKQVDAFISALDQPTSKSAGTKAQ